MYTIGGELYHYGVKGMKWGVRRYQPYPSGKQGSFIGDKVKKVTARKQAMERRRSRVINRLNKEGDDIYEQTSMSKEYKKWKKKNPYSDNDDFDDYLIDKDFKKTDWDKAAENAANKKYREARKLGKDYVKSQMAAGAVTSSIVLAPITAVAAAALAPKGKKLASAAMASLGMVALTTGRAGMDAAAEKRRTEKKYGIRGKNNKQGGISATSGAVAAKAKLAYMKSVNQQAKLTKKSNSGLKGGKLQTATNKAFKDNPSLTYKDIYKEMKVNTSSEDPSVYREAEEKWLKKHKYL